eukprot:SM000088S23723  [mRNA]  locus=s88:287334:290931:+ [translate_table: standard]
MTGIAVACLLAAVPRIGSLSSLVAAGDVPALLRHTGVLLAVVAARSVALYFQSAWLWEAALGATLAMRRFVFAAVQRLDMERFEGRGSVPVGDTAYRLTAEAEDAGDTIYAFLHMLVPSIVQLAAMFGRMVTLSPLLTLATFCVLPLMSVVIAVLGEKLRGLSRKGQDSIASLAAYINELIAHTASLPSTLQVLAAALVVKAHAAEEFEERRFEALAATDCVARLRKRKMKAFIPEVITGVYALTVLALFLVGTWAISRGTFTGQGMVSFLTSLIFLIDPIQSVGSAYNEIKQGEPAIERLLALATLAPKVVEKDGATVLKSVQGDIAFENVNFAYEVGQPWILFALNLKVKSGETVAIVGPSGGGKTTLVKLALRLYDPVLGSIHIDGHDLRDVTLKSLRQAVGIVTQDTVLFTGSVSANIAYGVLPEHVDSSRVETCARLANAHSFIARLPQGYDTHLGDRATSLSGGQRQRLAIARAIYHEPSILILDEATSALDNESEGLVQEALERLMSTRTVLVIAHRLGTIQRADRILVLEGGTIVEEGDHASLLATANSRYASLYSRAQVAVPQ